MNRLWHSHSAEYLAINSILTDALKKSNMFFISYSETDQVERFAGRSVGDLFRDRLDNPYETATFLHERTSELLRLLSVKDVPMEQDCGVFGEVHSRKSFPAS